MTDTQPIDLEKVTDQVQKLLAKGRQGGTEAECAAFMAKAMELLARHNLDMAEVESRQAGSAKREKAAQAGGQYVYQRELWKAVATLDFCMYFTNHVWRRQRTKDGFDRQVAGRQHLVVGRTVNTRATIAMATYLEGTADRLCRERLATNSGMGATPGELNSQFYSSWAVSFRVGVVDRIIEKIEERRAEHIKEENKKRRAAERAASGAGSTATALSLSTFKSAEEDANIDFLHGAGTAAEWAADRAARAAERAADEAEFTRWAKENPQDAKDHAKRRKKWTDLGYTFARVSRGGSSPRSSERGPGYWAGHEAGEGVGIDPQASAGNARRLT